MLLLQSLPHCFWLRLLKALSLLSYWCLYHSNSSSKAHFRLFLGREMGESWNMEYMERAKWDKNVQCEDVRPGPPSLSLSGLSPPHFSLLLFIWLSQLIFLSHSFTLSPFQMMCFCTVTQLNVFGLLPISFSLFTQFLWSCWVTSLVQKFKLFVPELWEYSLFYLSLLRPKSWAIYILDEAMSLGVR